ncbi:MAG: transporter [Bacteroidales bacterium]|nr:transporter [Bacteroidales bacterium]
MGVRKVIKEWMLPIAMVTGASLYLIYHFLPEPVHRIGPFLDNVVSVLQPLLIFSMLFLTFCGIEPRDLKPHRWHWWLLLIQGGLFSLLGLVVIWGLRNLPDGQDCAILVESAMLCLICPTATAAAVVTRKLGGDMAGITTYTILINMLTAVLVPLFVPLIRPVDGVDFFAAFSMILAKVFPLLIMPCLCAWLVRYMFPRLHRRLLDFADMPFYIWAVALTLAIAVSVRYLMASTLGLGLIAGMAAVSLISCVFQFMAGRYVGSRYRPRRKEVSQEAARRGRLVRTITAGQSLGQKNTVFAIWMGYTFMTPETAIVGGLYSIWHNIYNSWQLRRAEEQINKPS